MKQGQQQKASRPEAVHRTPNQASEAAVTKKRIGSEAAATKKRIGREAAVTKKRIGREAAVTKKPWLNSRD